MKRTLIILLTLLMTLTGYSQTEWQRGYKNGYKEGYCYGKFGCISPNPPPSIPALGEKNDNYQDGYNNGFNRGSGDSKRTGNNNQGSGFTSQTPNRDQQRLYMQEQAVSDLNNWQSDKDKQKQALIQITKNYYQSFQSYPSTIADGWHNVKVTNNFNFIEDRKVLVSNNQIVKYVKDNWKGLKINSSGTINNAMAMTDISGEEIRTKWDEPVQANSSLEIYFMDYLSDPNSKVSVPLATGTLMFFLKSKKKAQVVSVFIEDHYVGEISQYFTDENFHPKNCGINGCLTLTYKTGAYEYRATSTKHNFFGSRTTSWSGTITVDADKCNIFGLKTRTK